MSTSLILFWFVYPIICNVFKHNLRRSNVFGDARFWFLLKLNKFAQISP